MTEEFIGGSKQDEVLKKSSGLNEDGNDAEKTKGEFNVESSEVEGATPVAIVVETPDGDLGQLALEHETTESKEAMVTVPSDGKEYHQLPSADTDAKVGATTNLTKQQMIQQITDYKQKISSLINNVRDTKSLCEKYEHNNQYLQEYIGTLMKDRK